MASLFDRGEPVIMVGVGLAFGSEVDEEAVVAVERGLGQRFAIDRDQPFAMLACGFRNQLFGPGAEIGDLRRRENRYLVAAFEAGVAHHKSELHGGIFMRWYVRA